MSTEISAACRRAIGQEVISLDPLGLGRLKAGGFNPLDLFDGDMQEDEVVAAVLADALLPGPEGDTESGADATGLARRLLQALLLLVGTRTQGPGRTLTKVLRLADKLRDKPAATRRILSATRHPFPRALAEIAAKPRDGRQEATPRRQTPYRSDRPCFPASLSARVGRTDPLAEFA